MWTFASTFTKEDARVFHSLVQEAIRRTENARGCELYNRNFKIRLQNIENFLNGALPAFPPELDEEEREIMTPAALRIKEEAEKALNGRSNDWRNLLTESEASKAPAPAAPEPKSATLQAKKVA
jgi:c-di-GMP-related signal transduction protein